MKLVAATLALGLTSACLPELDDHASRITDPRVVAVLAEPPEVSPGETSHLELLYATPTGPGTAAARWTLCRAPRPPIENNPVPVGCLDDVAALGDGATMDAALPADACALFGPDTPPGDFRPRAADPTGGYYQPIGAEIDGQESFGSVRLACNLAGASPAVASEFRDRYRRNRNPVLGSLTARVDGRATPLDRIPRGVTVDLAIAWPAASAESFLVFDSSDGALHRQRERLTTSWFATAGQLDLDRTDEGGSGASLDGWTAPTDAITSYLFVVVRDSRGGSATATFELVTR